MGLQGFVEGGLASIAAGCTTHPLDLIKVRMQLQGEIVPTFKPAFALATPLPPQHHPVPFGPFAIAARIIHTEGVPALFSGVSATVLRQTLYSSTRLGLYEVLTRRWSSSENRPPVLQKIAAGLIAGGVGAAVGNPADVALVRMQADGRLPCHMRRNYCGVGDALFQMVRQEGIISLWRGSSLTVQRAMVVTASQLATYDQVKEGLLHHHRVKDGVALHVTASCIAGLVASAASNPLDVIKTRIMNMRTEPGQHPVYSGALDCAMKTVNSEGLMSLYKGFAPTVMRQGPYTVVLFVTLEQIKRLFGHS